MVPPVGAMTGGFPGPAKSSPSWNSAPRKYRIPYSLVMTNGPDTGRAGAPLVMMTPVTPAAAAAVPPLLLPVAR